MSDLVVGGKERRRRRCSSSGLVDTSSQTLIAVLPNDEAGMAGELVPLNFGEDLLFAGRIARVPAESSSSSGSGGAVFRASGDVQGRRR